MESFIKFKNRVHPKNTDFLAVCAAEVEAMASKVKSVKMENKEQFEGYYKKLFEKIFKKRVLEILMDESQEMWYCKVYKK